MYFPVSVQYNNLKHINFSSPLAPLLGEIEMCVHWLFCMKFNSQQLLFEQFFDLTCNFTYFLIPMYNNILRDHFCDTRLPTYETKFFRLFLTRGSSMWLEYASLLHYLWIGYTNRVWIMQNFLGIVNRLLCIVICELPCESTLSKLCDIHNLHSFYEIKK